MVRGYSTIAAPASAYNGSYVSASGSVVRGGSQRGGFRRGSGVRELPSGRGRNAGQERPRAGNRALRKAAAGRLGLRSGDAGHYLRDAPRSGTLSGRRTELVSQAERLWANSRGGLGRGHPVSN